jgi:hypothetical protein
MSDSAAIAVRKSELICGIFSSSLEHSNSAQPRKRCDDTPSACGLAPRTLNVLHHYASGRHGKVSIRRLSPSRAFLPLLLTQMIAPRK